MEKMYQEYKDVAEFHIIYIREAHASDGRSMQWIGKNLDIKEHTSYGERCAVAERFAKDQQLAIPCVIDGMDNKVNEAYRGWPDRVFLVRKDGKLAVAAKRGPWGFPPALKEAEKWLAAFKKTGEEPALPEVKPDEDKEQEKQPKSGGGKDDKIGGG